VTDVISLRYKRLGRLAQAKAVLEARAQECAQAEQTEVDGKPRAPEEKARRSKHRGRMPKPPEPGPRSTVKTTSPRLLD
jgi:hypothetical protein